MNVLEMKIKIDKLEEKYFKELMADSYDSNFMNEINNEKKQYKYMLDAIEKANELSDLLRCISNDKFSERIEDCIKNYNNILEMEDFEI